MQRLLDVPQAPIFHAALSQALQSMELNHVKDVIKKYYRKEVTL